MALIDNPAVHIHPKATSRRPVVGRPRKSSPPLTTGSAPGWGWQPLAPGLGCRYPSPMGSTRISLHINAPRPRVYAALVDADAIAQWKVPDGMVMAVHAFEAREGGGSASR